MDDYLTPPQLMAQLQVSRSTLAQWRMTGQGPRFVKLGRKVLYRVTDVNDWLATRTRNATSKAAR